MYAKCQLATLVLDKKFQVLSVVQTIVFLMEKAHFILVIRAAILPMIFEMKYCDRFSSEVLLKGKAQYC